MYVVAGDGRPAGAPELRAAGAPAAWPPDFPVVGVVADDLIVIDGDVGASSLEAVLAVVFQAGICQDSVGPEHYPRAGVMLHRDVVDPPAGSHAIVDDPLTIVVPGCPEVLDGQVS